MKLVFQKMFHVRKQNRDQINSFKLGLNQNRIGIYVFRET